MDKFEQRGAGSSSGRESGGEQLDKQSVVSEKKNNGRVKSQRAAQFALLGVSFRDILRLLESSLPVWRGGARRVRTVSR